MKEFATQTYGSDYNMLRCTRAQLRCPEAIVYCANILQYPVAAHSIDCIFFNHVIEYIQNDIEALQVVRRILKPGGLLVLGAPNEGCWGWQLAYKRDPESLRTTDHIHFYTAQTLCEGMRSAGFTIHTVHHMGWGPPDWALDGKIRKHKWVDDLFEAMGRVLFPQQASSLYITASKK